MKNIIFVFIIAISTFSSFGQFKKDFKDFVILNLPIDRQLIGTIRVGQSFTGKGISEDNIIASRSLEKYFATDSTKFKFEILDVLNSTFHLDRNKFEITDLKDLEVADCSDYGMLPLVRNNTVVISTVRVKSLEITSKKTFDAQLKVDLGNYIQNSNLKFDPSITYNTNKATVKTGKDLVVAVKAIKIESKPGSYFFSSKRATVKGDNTFEFYEPDFRVNSQIAFLSCDNLASYIKDEKDFNKHQGCFTVSFVNPIASQGDNQLIGGQLLLCPKKDKVTGSFKLTDVYRPSSNFQGNVPRQIAAILAGNELVRYTFQINSINSVSYDNAPETYVSNSNYTLDKTDMAWEVKKFKYNFSVVRK